MLFLRKLWSLSNIFWTKKGQKKEFSERFIKHFEGREYEKALIEEFCTFIHQYEEKYKGLFSEVISKIDEWDFEESKLHWALSSIHDIDFPQVYQRMLKYHEHANGLLIATKD